DRYMVLPAEWYDDPTKAKFGEPAMYRILVPTTPNPLGVMQFQTGALVHESRTIRWRGARPSGKPRPANFGGDDSVLQRVDQVLVSCGVAGAGVTRLFRDASQGVMKVKGLLAMIAGNQKDAMLLRAQLNDETRSLARMLLIDADSEDFTRVATPFGGI